MIYAEWDGMNLATRLFDDVVGGAIALVVFVTAGRLLAMWVQTRGEGANPDVREPPVALTVICSVVAFGLFMGAAALVGA